MAISFSYSKDPHKALRKLKQGMAKSILAKAMRKSIKPVSAKMKTVIAGTVGKTPKRKPKKLRKKVGLLLKKLRERKPAVKRRTGFLQKSIGPFTKSYKGAAVGMAGPKRKFIREDGVFKKGRRKGEVRKIVPANYAHLAGPKRKERFRKPAFAGSKRPWERINTTETARLVRAALRG